MREIYLAYDGSISGDWISLYAVHMAKAADGRLTVLHVPDGEVDPEIVRARLDRLERWAEEFDVSVTRRVLPQTRDVAQTLIDGADGHRDAVLVCGLRARESGHGLLKDTVSVRLLEAHRHDVLAVRVLAPGLLGAPRHVLYAASRHILRAEGAASFLRLLAPPLEEVSILRVATIPTLRGHAITPGSREHLIGEAAAHLRRVRAAIEPALLPYTPRVETHTALASDWANEIVRHGAQVKAQLILLGATERTLPMRVLAGNPLERVLRNASCDVAIFRSAKRG